MQPARSTVIEFALPVVYRSVTSLVGDSMFYRGPFYHDSSYPPLPDRQRALPWLPLLVAQAVWWAAMLSSATVVAVLLTLQLALAVGFDRKALPSIAKWLLIVLSGLAVDALSVSAGLLQFRDADAFGLPGWLVLLWCSFALTVPRLQQLLVHRSAQTVFFVCAGPLSYFAGAALAAATIIAPFSYALMATVSWLLLPWLWRQPLPRLGVRSETRWLHQ